MHAHDALAPASYDIDHVEPSRVPVAPKRQRAANVASVDSPTPTPTPDPPPAAPFGSPSPASCSVSPKATAAWSYETAFARNLGLINECEQDRLRECRVAICGMGGVGGVHLMTLVRMGIGRFTIADYDTFEVANFNRQCGATLSNVGRSKVEAMAEAALEVNPELDLRVIDEPVDATNIDAFLEDADLLIDGIDFFAIEARRVVFREARKRGLWSITAGPVGFSTAWLTFDPRGMSFDAYFDLNDHQDRLDQLIAFAVGLAPRSTHLAYLDLSRVNIASGAAPSAALACQLASGVMAAEALKILLNRGGLRPAPYYAQFDAYRGLMRHGRLRGGNRNTWQRVKRMILWRRLEQQRNSLRHE